METGRIEYHKKRYEELRHKLTDLNYGGNFSMESLEVVDHMMSLLTQTRVSYKEVQDKESRLAADLALAQAQLFPLRKENSRLTRENHQLHVDNIRQTDQAANMFSEQNVSIKKLQDDLHEMNLVVRLKEEQMQKLDKERERIREVSMLSANPPLLLS